MKQLLSFTVCFLFFSSLFAQKQKIFTHADTLRGSITPERAWWDVLTYYIEVKPHFETKTIKGKTDISYAVLTGGTNKVMQIDLQQPLIIDSISDGVTSFNHIHKLKFTRTDNVCFVYFENKKFFKTNHKAPMVAVEDITIYYHGKPREAVKPPWDGGWIWKKDAQGRPWMSVACQGLGASVWYPCKDIQSDEPDNGALLSIIVPDTLVAVGNGRLISTQKNNDGTTTYKWEVKNPINNYDIVPYIGKYVNFSDTMHGEKGTLDLSYWVLDYALDSAKKQFEQVKPMLHNLEYWFGPYPFYEDSYKLVQAPHLGMEHQSAVAYGNHFQNGYLGIDLSATGWGLKWDFIIEHESSHEWFGNNITSKDLADMWIHESFGNYSETLYTEHLFGKDAGNIYNVGTRKRIENDEPIIAPYNVNAEGSGDMYYKGGNMLQGIRHIINNDSTWRNILRGLNKTFYHQTVTTKQVEDYISKQSKIDFSKVFDQYLRTTQIPQLSYYYSKDSMHVFYKWDSCVTGFNMQLVLWHDDKSIRIKLTQQWQQLNDVAFFNIDWISKNYYINIKKVQANVKQ